MNTEQTIQKQLADNPVILYMKGVPKAPECGFSAKAVQALDATGIAYAYVNVLTAPFIREKLPKISHWPTYPQLFVNGELVGGSDIVEQMANDGSLVPLLQKAGAAPEKAEGLGTEEIAALVKQGVAAADVYVTGAGCDLTVTVVSAAFADLAPVKKQQMVLAPLAAALNSGKLHSVSVKTYTPDEWAQQRAAQTGLLQIQT